MKDIIEMLELEIILSEFEGSVIDCLKSGLDASNDGLNPIQSASNAFKEIKERRSEAIKKICLLLK